MRIITVDNRTWDVKYMQNKESITNDFGTVALNYPDFIGSKLRQNSSSSDKYSLTFSIHRTLFVGFKESIKKFVTKLDDAVENETYGKLQNIIIEHALFGAVQGKIVGSISYNTASEADIMCNCTFQEETADEPEEKRDIEVENEEANEEIDTETDANYDVVLLPPDLAAIANFAANLRALYSKIKNSKVISAFNNLESELNKAIIDSQKVMNAVKDIISLPNKIVSSVRSKLDLFQAQAEAIKNIPVTSFNLAKFNMNVISFNLGATSRTAFVSEAALQAAAGIKTVPL